MNLLTTCSGRSDLGDSNTRPAELQSEALATAPKSDTMSSLMTCSGQMLSMSFDLITSRLLNGCSTN